jgi:hypothetical protein
MTVLKRTTLATFIRVLDDLKLPYTINRQDMVMTFPNGSEILFLELDHTKDPDFNKIKGLELTTAAIDEINEILQEAFSILITRVGRWNPHNEPSHIMGTCNPSTGWVKQMWYEPWSAGTIEPPYYFLQSLATDNPFLPPKYIKNLEYLPAPEYQRYVLGNWDFVEDPFQLITYQMIKNNFLYGPIGLPVGEKKLGVDVARSGDDDTTAMLTDDEKLLKARQMHGNDTVQTAVMVKNIVDEEAIVHSNVKIDTIGVGAGTFDALKHFNPPYNVVGFNSGETPSDRRDDSYEFYNKRAEAYWQLRQRFIDGKMGISPDELQLIEELTNVRYEIRGKKVIIEDKDKIKKRIMRSPDRADGLMMSVYTPKVHTLYFGIA